MIALALIVVAALAAFVALRWLSLRYPRSVPARVTTRDRLALIGNVDTTKAAQFSEVVAAWRAGELDVLSVPEGCTLVTMRSDG